MLFFVGILHRADTLHMTYGGGMVEGLNIGIENILFLDF